MHGVVPSQVQDPAFAFVELHQVPLCPTFQPIHITLGIWIFEYQKESWKEYSRALVHEND